MVISLCRMEARTQISSEYQPKRAAVSTLELTTSAMARKNAKKVSKPAATTKQVAVADSAPKTEEAAAPVSGTYGWVLKLLAVAAALAVTYFLRQLDVEVVRAAHYIARSDVTEHLRFNVTCAPMKVGTGVKMELQTLRALTLWS
ncbi:unnamed protein product [Phytophthora lilii]|uniref:Unnamed protein product n=1 Tax=Phytophthora lilii TaxID=2077276 RepID=A0A9W6X475_9STRA|nr:unnamed protein product [Phytophthora lilii]